MLVHLKSPTRFVLLALLSVFLGFAWCRPFFTPFMFMWAVALAIFFVFKIATLLAHSDAYRRDRFSLWVFVYLFLWPGMDPAPFLSPSDDGNPLIARHEYLSAFLKVGIGAMLVWGIYPWVPDQLTLFRGWIGMLGVVMTLHFGVFHLLSMMWRFLGVHAQPLFVLPLFSTSLASFWGGRWNLAFRDLTHRFVYQPIRNQSGPIAAIFMSFLMSGLIHEMVISWPAQAGYGLPTIYFLCQAIGIVFERSSWGRSFGLARGGLGSLFTLIVTAAPLPLLFHRAFIERVIVPFIEFIQIKSF